MRIIGGTLGGLKINPPAKMPNTRPTTDIAKEGLFNILQHQVNFEGMCTLDLFGGTGAITYELQSRGAAQSVIVEKDAQMFTFIKKKLELLHLQSSVKALKMDVFTYLNTCTATFDFIFAGPPYALKQIDDLPRLIISCSLLKPDGIFVLEHTPRNQYDRFEGFERQRNYGTTVFSFFKPKAHD